MPVMQRAFLSPASGTFRGRGIQEAPVSAVASGHSRPFCVKLRPLPGLLRITQSTEPARSGVSQTLTRKGAAVLKAGA